VPLLGLPLLPLLLLALGLLALRPLLPRRENSPKPAKEFFKYF